MTGAAAYLMHKGDIVIIMSYGIFEDSELKDFHPVILFEVNGDNNIISIPGPSS